MITRLGLTLNRRKTRLCDARKEQFDFLGYSFAHLPPDRTASPRGSPSKKSVQRLKDEVGVMLVLGNVGRWEEVRRGLNRLLRGWGGYFSPGSHYVADGVIDAHVYDRVRSFLARRYKRPKRSIGPFSLKVVFGELGVLRMRHCRHAGVLSRACREASRKAGCGKSARPV